MKTAWVILIVSALTDAIVTFATALNAAMMASGVAELPSDAVLMLTGVGSLVAFARTIQQGLKAGNDANLKGEILLRDEQIVSPLPVRGERRINVLADIAEKKQ